ncbi:undecaprenyldiphospho-muramoylpentapeptide beta-N-acetylglucosaminyltransferase [Chondromyces apiculatus]|uniref:UDP-N-acetylglucosamine--N-acetylmuramyl-(pentapeptide) pyrophosphoryl-undecaprenol N-acetylglucosamine transferase n=1 Tax=Chondromyces apiculatus DSM 436 TaxID=1192034 RepID=A0A017T1D8_9BACT|nr:undecaprenyldiphospho-muramoylpentapeptide beta-N-acetylglucosaminyltransferase [Chondromyces apiculatus]EYF02386.1 UDP-N-acetylglucosamine pyrophosphoryl-undecaprenol N-acetylglucosamine transferase [Chondromyces apiculatus DSM 436]
MTTIVIAGGGTGGHVFPMVAVGDALRAMGSAGSAERAAGEVRVVYVGTARGIEVQVMGGRGDTLELLEILPLRGGGARGFARGAAAAARALPEARRLIQRLDARAVLSLGGYAGGPAALAARSLGIPITILEPNSVLGLSNRLLVPFVARAYINFPETARGLRASTVRRFGVPLRRAFSRAPYGARAGKLSLLVLGGSQGAVALNQTLPRALARCRADGLDVEIVHQTGKAREAEVRALYAELGIEAHARVVPFIDDIAAALAAADVVVARSGASTVAELCAVGRPAILIPYPFAADDHQMKNARSVERVGGALALAQSEASEARIAQEIAALAGDPGRRERMAEAAATLGAPDAAQRVAEDLLALARAAEERPRAWFAGRGGREDRGGRSERAAVAEERA